MATIGERIKALRTAVNLNQEEFGKQFGLVKSTVSLYENGKSTPDDETKKKICEKYNVSMDWLYGLTDYLLGTERSEKQEGIRMNLKQLRERAGLSQAELGNLVGLKQTTISQYENRTRQPNLDLTQKIADVLEVSLDELVRPLENRVESNEEDLGYTIANLRKSKNMTQREFAHLLGVSNGAVAMWETNKRQPDLDTLRKIAKYYDVSVDYLLGLEDVKSKKLQMGDSDKEDLQKIITDLCQITQNLKAWIERNL